MQLIAIVEMRHEPVLCVLEHVGRDRADLLCRVGEPESELGSLLRDSVVDKREIRIGFLRKKVVGLLEIHLDEIGWLVGNETIHCLAEDTHTKPVRVGPLDDRIALREVNYYDFTCAQQLNYFLLIRFLNRLCVETTKPH